MATTTNSESRVRLSAVFEPTRVGSRRPRWPAFLLVFGLFLTLRGYHSFDGDQAYRLPILLHWQDPSLYSHDPFVRAFDVFNPHRGYLTLLDLASRPFGLAAALLGLFGLTLVATSLAVDRLGRMIWPDLGSQVGLMAVVLFLLAKAGNIGTNHLFESTLLDRLIGFALGWLAIAAWIGGTQRSVWMAAGLLGIASLIHPSVGLQLALTLAASWVVWGLSTKWSRVSRRESVVGICLLGLALVPGMILMSTQSGRLLEGLPAEEFRLLAVLIQGPQHMLPSTWRMPQWLAWGCYPTLAILALGRSSRPWPASRVRMAILMGVNLLSLVAAYIAVEFIGDLRVTIFQPFRMATLARGLALAAVAGRLVQLWGRGDLPSRGRAVLIAAGLGGDWSFVVATAVDLTMEAFEFVKMSARMTLIAGLTALSFGLVHLIRHDTESSQWSLLGGLGILVVGNLLARARHRGWTARRWALAIGISWAIPVSSLVVGLGLADPGASRWSAWLVERCRFAEVPADDLERLAVWCRDQTPRSSRFIGPPGPKTFRLWSRRSVAFNRAGSPYHAAGLADWASRFREHLGFQGTTAEFARAYLKDRHELEAAYGRMSDTELANLARSQGADHVLTASNRRPSGPDSPLLRLQLEGRFAVYRVRSVE